MNSKEIADKVRGVIDNTAQFIKENSFELGYLSLIAGSVAMCAFAAVSPIYAPVRAVLGGALNIVASDPHMPSLGVFLIGGGLLHGAGVAASAIYNKIYKTIYKNELDYPLNDVFKSTSIKVLEKGHGKEKDKLEMGFAVMNADCDLVHMPMLEAMEKICLGTFMEDNRGIYMTKRGLENDDIRQPRSIEEMVLDTWNKWEVDDSRCTDEIIKAKTHRVEAWLIENSKNPEVIAKLEQQLGLKDQGPTPLLAKAVSEWKDKKAKEKQEMEPVVNNKTKLSY